MTAPLATERSSIPGQPHRTATAGRGISTHHWAVPWSSGAATLAAIGIAAVLVWKLAYVLLLLFCAALIATILRGLADKLAEKLHASPRQMLAVVAIGLTILICGTIYWIGPRVAGQASDLFSRLATELQQFRDQYGNTPIGHALSSRLANPAGLENKAGTYAFSIASSTLTIVTDLFVVVVMSLYLALAARMYLDGTVRLFPQRHRALARSVLEEMAHALRRWLLGQAIDMVAVGGLSAVGLYFLGVPVPFALALLAGLLTIVPYFGAIAAGVPGVLVALTQSWEAAVWVVLIFLCCHMIEGYIIAPIVQRRMVEMPPAVVLGSMTIAAALFGPMGIVLGTPLAVVAMILVRRVYIEYILRDRDGNGQRATDRLGVRGR